MRTDKYMMAKAWMKQDQAPQSEALDTWNTLEAEFNEERKAMLMASAESDKIKAMMNEKYGPGTVKYGSEIKQPEVKTPQAAFEFSQRNPAADGGRMYQGQLISQLVTPNPDGSRPGYAPQPGWKKEKDKFLKWLKDNPDFDFANSSTPKIIEKSGTKFEVGTIQKLLNEKGIQTKHSIARTQETPKYTKKVLEELKKDLPPGVSVEQGRPGKYYFRIMLKGGKANKPTYRNSYVANEANKQIALDDFNKVSKEYYPGRLTNEEFKTLRLENKDMKTADFAKFLEGEGKTTYLGDKWSKDSVSYLQNKLDIGVGTTGPVTIRTVEESKKIIRKQPGAKFFFMGNPSDAEIKKYAANLAYQEKNLGKGGKKGFPVGMTKENKMFRNFYDSSRKKDGRIKIESKIPMDKDGDINWKMKDKDGVHEWKKVKFYDTKTGATYTWGKNYKPGDLRKQVDAAYGDGFFAKSVQTYDEQAKLNKTKFQGKALNEWMREGLLKKEFELKFNRKPTPSELKEWYALRKPSFSFTEAHHVEGVGENPFRMEVSYRAANRKQNNLLNSYKAGNLTKAQYTTAMENLSDTKGGIRYKTDGRFIGQTGTPESIITASGKDAGFSEKKIKTMLQSFCGYGQAQGGRIGLSNGSCSLDESQKGFTQYMEDAKNGKISTTSKAGAELAENAAKIAGKSVSFGKLFFGWTVAPEVVLEGAIGLHKYFDKGENVDQVLAKSYLTKPLRMLYDQTDGKTGIPGTEELLIKNSNIGPGGLEQFEIQKLESRLASLNNSLEKALIDDEAGLSEVDIGQLQNTIANTAFKLKMKKQSQKEGAGLEAASEEINLAKGEYQDKVGATKNFGKVNYDDATLTYKNKGRGRTGGIEQELIGKTKPNYTTVDKNIFSKDYRPLDGAQFNVIENALKRHPDIGMPDNLTFNLNPLNREVLQQKALPLARADAMNTIGMKGASDSFFKGTYTPKEKPVYDFSEGGITGLRSKYEYKK